MSSIPPPQPSLAEVIVRRTFEKPVRSMIDGELADVLARPRPTDQQRDDAPAAAGAVAPVAETGAQAPGGSLVDVRA